MTGIGTGVPGLGRPDPTPGAEAWLRVVTEWDDGHHRTAQVHRWPGYTAVNIRAHRLHGLREARANLTVHPDRIVVRHVDGDRTDTLTFHDTNPGDH